MYGLLTAKWFAVSDFVALARGGFGENRFPVPPGRSDVAPVILGKVLHLTWAIALPLLFFPWWGVLAFYLACHWLTGFILAVTFQLVYCTDRAEFFGSDVGRRGHDFELQQLSSTVDIRCRGSFAAGPTRWLMGGLDHQVVHHLSPRVPHNLYPQMASELDALCAERDPRLPGSPEPDGSADGPRPVAQGDGPAARDRLRAPIEPAAVGVS